MRQDPSWISDFNWCVDNDWQVYIIPGTYKDHRIAIRKGGITAHGKDLSFEEAKTFFTRHQNRK